VTDRDPMAGEQAAAERAPEQQGDSSWPRPGEEGYVHPDGTPQAARQLAENRQAAQDRAAAGSTVHGAPAATNDVQDPGVSAGIAEERAENYSGPTEAERRESLVKSVEEGRDAMADEQAAAAEQRAADANKNGNPDAARSAPPKPAAKSTAGKPGDQTSR
jgi:hypothetical protein